MRRHAERLPVEQHEEKFALYEQARALAAQLGEEWWVLFFEHWKLETLLFLKQDAKSALDLAVRAALEVRKPKYDALPQRLALQMNLVTAYTHLDPIGYAPKIREAFEYLRPFTRDHADYRPYFAQQWALFLQAIDDPQAVAAAWQHLARAGETRSGHYILFALLNVCSATYEFAPDQSKLHLGEFAQDAETLGRLEKRLSSVATAQMWQAVAARRDEGDEDRAQLLFRRAMATYKRTAPPRTGVHFPAIAFHEVAGDFSNAIKACNTAIRVFHDAGMDFREAEMRWKKCQLLALAGRATRPEIKRLLAVAAQLPSKSHWENKIKEVEG